jgi:ATP-dependent helicase/nuclease subunit B
MALQFIMGPPGSGKSHYLYEKVTKASLEHPETNYIVLVPEQFTMQTQKDLVMASPRKGIMNVDVLSFGRLAHRIFEETGGNQRKVLDDVGKSFVLRKIAGDCEAELRVLGSNLKKTGYIGEVKSVISEFTQYAIQEETLEQMIEEVKDSSNLYYKLQDIKTIYHGFREYLREKYITGEELLDVLCTVVGESKILKDSVVVLDGFTGFTPVQNKILRELFGVCKRVVITVTMEQKENPFSYKHPYQLFALSKQMVTSLITIAKETKTDVEEPIYLYDRPIYRFRENTALAFLEAHLFRYSKEQYEKEQDRIQVYCAKNPKEEVDFAAQKIRNLARTRGYRYREIAIIASDLNTYGNQIEKIFGEYQIPIFMDHKRSILLNSFVEYVRSLLAMVEQNFSYESVFRYLRTGLTGFSDEEIDIVENYVIALGIRGYKKWQEKWIRRARGMEETELERINDIKERFLIQVEDVTMVLTKRNKTVSEVTKALYDFLVKEELQKKVKEYEIRFGNDGELALEKEYGQVYRIVIELFDKFVELLGEEQIALKEYCELLDAGLEEAKVGVIPPSLDQVVAGDIERTRIKDIKAVFLLGANDMYIPGKENAGGILSEHDRELFQKGGVVLAPGAKEKAFIQKFYLYLLMTKPSEQLYVTYSKVSADGKTLRPAYLIQDLRRMYKKMEIQDADCQPDKKELTPKSGFAYLIEKLQKKHEGLGTEWQELYTWYRQNPKWRKKIEQIVEACFYEKPKDGLTTRTAQRLYGTILENSVTRLEKFSACAYAHFLSYGLNLREREEYTFQAIDLGNIFHSAIDILQKNWRRRGTHGRRFRK